LECAFDCFQLNGLNKTGARPIPTAADLVTVVAVALLVDTRSLPTLTTDVATTRKLRPMVSPDTTINIWDPNFTSLVHDRTLYFNGSICLATLDIYQLKT
jgi:hypothetical protein